MPSSYFGSLRENTEVSQYYLSSLVHCVFVYMLPAKNEIQAFYALPSRFRQKYEMYYQIRIIIHFVRNVYSA